MTEVTVETPEEEPTSDDTVVVAPTVIVPDSGDGDTQQAMALGAALAEIETLKAQVAELSVKQEHTEEVAEVALEVAVEEAMSEPEPEPVVVEVEPDEEPGPGEPWTHRKNPFSRR